jgi:hypothetical protein|tara:strand:+ start:620 stop:754 length:135 start_codon:yes stop_codon:yes gene_type:complete
MSWDQFRMILKIILKNKNKKASSYKLQAIKRTQLKYKLKTESEN